ncbi:hypothetical protein AgCh_010190 [Apium graveolens]
MADFPSSSSSSSHSASYRDPGKRPLEEGDEESVLNLDNLEIPDLGQCGSFDFLGSDEFLKGMPTGPLPSPPLSPRTLELRNRTVEESLRLGRIEFEGKPSLNYLSYYITVDPPVSKLESYMDLSNGYRYRVPTADERVWMMPEFGMHEVAMIMFQFGLRLPMHPFFLTMYEAIGCGLGQLTPNSIAQFSGFVALCCDKGRSPTLKLFFSIYGVRYYGGQVYFDSQHRRMKIVSVRSSNSGYHSQWLFVGGPDLEFVKPCGKVSQGTIDYLNNMEKHDTAYLDEFHGSRTWYTHLDLKESGFLEMHDLGGASLKKILDDGIRGGMDKAMMLLLQRATRKPADAARPGPLGVPHSVSIELLDDQGNKRLRREDDEVVVGGREAEVEGANRTVTIAGTRVYMGKTVDPRSKKEVVRVEIQPTERWTGGSTVPLRALNLFNLPQDSVAYDGRKREDLVDRCKSRAGRFLSDFMHILEDYKADVDGEACSKLEVEVAVLKGEKKKIAVGFAELEHRVADLSKANSALSNKVAEMEVADQVSSGRVRELEGRLLEVERELDEEKSKRQGLDRQVEGMDSSYKLIVKENEDLKKEVEKAVEDIADALGDGYGRCLQRMEEVGFAVEGQAFDDYLRDLASKGDNA